MAIVLPSACGWAQDPEPSATLQGMIQSSEGKPVAQAAVTLHKKGGAESLTTQTDTKGSFAFTKLQDGIYTLLASKDGYRDAQIESLSLRLHETKFVDLTLGILKPDKASAVSAPQFFDQPQFTVSGVTDTTNLGGHGSDTVVRTRDSLAKETVTLSGTAPMHNDATAVETDYPAARLALEKEVAAHETADLHHRLADIEEKLGDSLAAVRHYQRAAELDPTEPYLFDWGAELLLHHAPEPAVEVFSKGTQKYPKSSRMLIGLGAATFARGNTDDAIRQICQASDLSPSDASPYLFLGKIEQSEITPPEDLVDKLHRFVTLQPHSADANYYYAVGRWKQRNRSQKPDTAAQVESLLKNALQLDPRHALAELQLGIVHADQRAYEEAISNYQKALEVDPQLEEAHYRLAQAYRETGQPDKAKEEVRLYGQLAKESAQKQDRERHEIKQFVYTLRDQPQSQ